MVEGRASQAVSSSFSGVLRNSKFRWDPPQWVLGLPKVSEVIPDVLTIYLLPMRLSAATLYRKLISAAFISILFFQWLPRVYDDRWGLKCRSTCKSRALPQSSAPLLPLVHRPHYCRCHTGKWSKSWRNLNLTSNLEEVIHLCLARLSFKNLRMLNLTAANHPGECWRSQTDEANSDMSSAKKQRSNSEVPNPDIFITLPAPWGPVHEYHKQDRRQWMALKSPTQTENVINFLTKSWAQCPLFLWTKWLIAGLSDEVLVRNHVKCNAVEFIKGKWWETGVMNVLQQQKMLSLTLTY